MASHGTMGAGGRALVPTTRLGIAGALLAALSVAVAIAVIVADATRSGPDPDLRLGWSAVWLIVVASGILTGVALGRGERAVLAWIALVPTALFAVLLVMELVGLME